VKEFVLYVFTKDEDFKPCLQDVKNRFEVIRFIVDPLWLRNSIYYADHLGGRCYCKWSSHSRLT